MSPEDQQLISVDLWRSVFNKNIHANVRSFFTDRVYATILFPKKSVLVKIHGSVMFQNDDDDK